MKCAKIGLAQERTLSEPCADKRRAARLWTKGKPWGDPERAKRYERERRRHQRSAHQTTGICVKCQASIYGGMYRSEALAA